jgi:hypothetical protein
MAKNPKWYAGGFVLVTLAESRDGYQHPRVSVVVPWASTPSATPAYVDGLPTNYDHPTHGCETVLAFEFQQNIGANFNDEPSLAPERSAAGSWCNLREDGKTSRPYGGHLSTPSLRVESWGIDTRNTAAMLRDVDRAIKRLRDERKALGVPEGADDTCTQLILALKRSFRLPVLFVVYRGYRDAIGFPAPDLSSLDTARRLAALDRRTREGWGAAAAGTN